MAGQDYFAEIAMTKHPIHCEDKEIPPMERTKVYYEESAESFPYGTVKTAKDSTYEERLSKFSKDLKALKEQYAPFLENHISFQAKKTVNELKEFQFRYCKPHEIFSQMEQYENESEWEKVTIPDYRGPAKEDGKWRAYYRTHFTLDKKEDNQHVIAQFQCVDYKAFIYVNGNYVGQHEGLFAPFAFDITDYVSDNNELVIEVHNDIPTMGEGPIMDGDKIYAATGPGWDDPYIGWHHCPAGAGVFGKVTIETRPEIYIDDIFVRPNIDEDFVELRLGVINYGEGFPEDFDFTYQALPKNFTGDESYEFKAKMKVIARGKNEYRYHIPMKNFRLWTPDTPYLYGAVCRIEKDNEVVTNGFKHFGMRKFVSDETTNPKGKFFFNNEPCILRGANEMGHLQQCVMQGDFDQLIEDILIGKLCNMNYYRITQRPVQEEIYDYMDMLGMMNQSDLPLFSFLRRNQVCEAVRQSAEMEHLLRSHPSAIMVTFINEPVCIRRTEDPNSKYSKRYDIKGQRNLLRDELEAFFVAARKMIYVENPDRVIKNVEGDYDPPTAEGMPDFHTYTMWYTNHPMPIGKLMRGYIPPVKAGWMIGCGEYGAEGLDDADLMRRRYPKEWLAKNEQGEWYPTEIVRAQTNAMHGDWFAEQTTMEDWVRESQEHQANATKLMTDAFRRRADYIGHTAIHLLIDAWPAGWMKTLVDCERKPKRAYFAYADALEKVRVNLRCDRIYVESGQKIDVESWLLNDSSKQVKGKIIASVRLNGQVLQSVQLSVETEAASSVCTGLIPVRMPAVDKKETLYVDAVLLDENGNALNAETYEFVLYPSKEQARTMKAVACVGERAEQMAELLGYEKGQDKKALLISEIEGNEQKAEEYLQSGRTVVAVLPDVEAGVYHLGGFSIETKKGPKVFFAAARDDVKDYALNFLYNAKEDYIDFTGRKVIESEEGEELLYTYGQRKDGVKAPKLHRPFVKKYRVGAGTLYVISLVLDGKVGYNANLDKFIIDCLENRL